MSQAKVEQYKKDKANRKKIMKREKQKRILEYSICGILAALVLVWIGFSIYQKVQPAVAPENAATSDIDFSDLEDALNASDVTSDTDTEADADAEADAATEETDTDAGADAVTEETDTDAEADAE